MTDEVVAQDFSARDNPEHVLMCADAERRANSEDFAVAKVTEFARAEAARLADDVDFATAARVSEVFKALYEHCRAGWGARDGLNFRWEGSPKSGYHLSISVAPSGDLYWGAFDRVTLRNFFDEVAHGTAAEIKKEHVELVGRIVDRLAERADGLRAFELPVGTAIREKLGSNVATFYRHPLTFSTPDGVSMSALVRWSRISGAALLCSWHLSEPEARLLEMPAPNEPVEVLPVGVTASEAAYKLQRALLFALNVENGIPWTRALKQQRTREQERARQPSVCGPDLYGEEFELTAEELRAAELRIAGRKGAR